MPRENKGRGKFRTISLPSSLAGETERVIDSLKYWPTKTNSVREAVLERPEKYRKQAIGNHTERESWAHLLPVG
jgi:hypothetical protein